MRERAEIAQRLRQLQQRTEQVEPVQRGAAAVPLGQDPDLDRCFRDQKST
ncbi:hypothetical protein O7621_11030 [Solwaraspora sp. WMMD937]|nr:hypothetical protein [Solwaraspora sp. WMMD937]WFE23751.1 hypothetical protein O7621_11030 [Solwaraspora sp. WMMD937]